MRVAVVHTYSAPADQERHEAQLLHRDRALAGLLAERTGWTVAGFGCTEGRQPVVQGGDDGWPEWTWLPLDCGQPARLRGLRQSHALLEAVAASTPDVLLIKGIGTPLSDGLIRMSPDSTAVGIVGGRYRYPAATGVRLALTENAEQDVYFRRRLGPRGFLRLPKLVETRFFMALGQRAAPKAFDVVCVGSFHPLKNQQALLALREHALRVAFVGEGPERDRLQRAFAGGRADVRFLGNVSKQEVAQVLACSRVMVHPSRSEGFPRAIAEAMAAGAAVVAVKGVVSDPVVPGRNGMLVPEAQLVPQVLDLLGNPSRLEELGRQARRTAEQDFSLSALQDAVDRLVPRLEAARRTPTAGGRLLELGLRRARALHDGPAAAGLQARAHLQRFRRPPG